MTLPDILATLQVAVVPLAIFTSALQVLDVAHSAWLRRKRPA